MKLKLVHVRNNTVVASTSIVCSYYVFMLQKKDVILKYFGRLYQRYHTRDKLGLE